MSKNDEFYELLEKERLTYCEGNYTLPTCLENNFRQWNALLREDDDALKRRSSGRRSIRRRSRDILKDILTALGPEVLLLCTLVTTMDKLAKLEPKGLVSSLQRWWDASLHPQSLANAANTICETYTLNNLMLRGEPDEQVVLSNNVTNMSSPFESQSEIPVVSENSGPNIATRHAVAAFENAIYLAAQCIPEMERQAWISSCFEPLQSLKRLSNLPLSVPGVCLVAYWDRLGNILGNYLFEGMETSWARYMERHREDKGQLRLTSAVNLYLADSPGDDFKLTVCLRRAIGEAICAEKAGTSSAEAWKKILGDYLFDGMMASSYRRKEEVTGTPAHTSPVDVIFFGDSGDCKLVLMLNFAVGREIWHQAF